MQTQCIRIPLHPEHADTFLDFAAMLGRDPRALADVLREEGMSTELVLVDRSQDRPALILFTRSADLSAAHEVLQTSDHPVQVRMRGLSAKAFDLAGAQLLEVLIDYDEQRNSDAHQS